MLCVYSLPQMHKMVKIQIWGEPQSFSHELCLYITRFSAYVRSAYVRIAHAGRPWSSRTTTVESNMKSEHNLYLACEDSPQRAFFFCTFSCSRLALLASTVHWLRCFLFLNAANCWLRSVLDSAKPVRWRGPTALSYPSSVVKKRHSSLSSMIHC